MSSRNTPLRDTRDVCWAQNNNSILVTKRKLYPGHKTETVVTNVVRNNVGPNTNNAGDNTNYVGPNEVTMIPANNVGPYI